MPRPHGTTSTLGSARAYSGYRNSSISALPRNWPLNTAASFGTASLGTTLPASFSNSMAGTRWFRQDRLNPTFDTLGLNPTFDSLGGGPGARRGHSWQGNNNFAFSPNLTGSGLFNSFDPSQLTGWRGSGRSWQGNNSFAFSPDLTGNGLFNSTPFTGWRGGRMSQFFNNGGLQSNWGNFAGDSFGYNQTGWRGLRAEIRRDKAALHDGDPSNDAAALADLHSLRQQLRGMNGQSNLGYQGYPQAYSGYPSNFAAQGLQGLQGFQSGDPTAYTQDYSGMDNPYSTDVSVEGDQSQNDV